MAERVRSQSNPTAPRDLTPAWSWQGYTEHATPSEPAGWTHTTDATGTDSKTTTDWSSGNYPKRIKNGEILNNPFHSITIKETPRPMGVYIHKFRKATGTWCATHGTNHYTRYHYQGFLPVVSYTSGGGYLPVANRASIRQAVIDLAVTSAFANVDTSSMLAYATVAESRKTVDSLRAVLLRAFKIARNVRKLNVKGLLNEISPKELADRYMEARYAFRPLLIDAANICKALEEERRYLRRTFLGFADDTYTASGTALDVSGMYLTKMDFSKQTTYTVSARAGVLCDCDVSAVSTFGLDQLAETAWELVPFSFIVDWFTNVGDLIAAHTPNAGVNQRASWVTVRENLTQSITCTAHRSVANTAGYVNESITSPKGTVQRDEQVVERIVSPLLGTWPRFDLNLDAYKLTDLGIILRKVFS